MLQRRAEFQPDNWVPTASGISIQNLAFGALAGLSATMAMTAAMRALFKWLPSHERYPLPPRELTERILPLETAIFLRSQCSRTLVMEQ
jgi:hypothetical protein